MRKHIATAFLFALLCPVLAFGQNVITVTDADVVGDTFWSSENKIGRAHV